MPQQEMINYVELPAHDLAQVKAFFEQAFHWQFTDYGGDYCAFSGGGLDGGFYRSDACSRPDTGGALIVFYSSDLARSEVRILAAGGSVVKPTFSFPGGKRFHFCDPCGNEYGVWSDADQGE